MHKTVSNKKSLHQAAEFCVIGVFFLQCSFILSGYVPVFFLLSTCEGCWRHITSPALLPEVGMCLIKEHQITFCVKLDCLVLKYFYTVCLIPMYNR